MTHNIHPILDIRKLCEHDIHHRVNNRVSIPRRKDFPTRKYLIIYAAFCFSIFASLCSYSYKLDRYFCKNMPWIMRIDEFLTDIFPTFFAFRYYTGNVHVCQKFSI